MKSLVDIVKQNKWLYRLYSQVFSFCINIFKLFVKTDPFLILFVSYGGRYYNDSPRCIYEYMKSDCRFNKYRLVWGFKNPGQHRNIEERVRIDSFMYFVLALRARCWVTNVAIERGLSFTGKNTLYFHTTHGTIPKLSGYHDNKSHSFSDRFKYQYDISCAQSLYEKKLQETMYGLQESQILLSGYPKNDLLANATEVDYINAKKELGLPTSRKIILYAPTFRDESFGPMVCPIDFKKWESILGSDYLVMFRAHPVVASNTAIDSSSGFILDMSGFPDNNILMLAADVLISDYSGIFMEFGVQDKPMFCFAYDYDEYCNSRGLFFDIRKELPGGELNELELLDLIKNGDPGRIMHQVNAFRQKYITVRGHATEKCVNTIYELIKA